MIILACDHGGYDLCHKVLNYLESKKIDVKYMGPEKFDPDDDYPDIIKPACKEVLKDKDNVGIFFCGSGVGVNMVANRFKGIRAVCAQDYTLAFLARKDEDANVLTLGGRTTSYRTALKIIKVFLTSEFEGGRHARRIAKY